MSDSNNNYYTKNQEKVRVSILQTNGKIVIGNLSVAKNIRLSDFLNSTYKFLTVTDCEEVGTLGHIEEDVKFVSYLQMVDVKPL